MRIIRRIFNLNLLIQQVRQAGGENYHNSKMGFNVSIITGESNEFLIIYYINQILLIIFIITVYYWKSPKERPFLIFHIYRNIYIDLERFEEPLFLKTLNINTIKLNESKLDTFGLLNPWNKEEKQNWLQLF